MYQYDIYILGVSDSFKLKARENAIVNLELKKVPPCYHTLLSGKVCCVLGFDGLQHFENLILIVSNYSGILIKSLY